MEIKKISFIGLGAIGSAYAFRLWQAAGDGVCAIADDERKQRYEKEGVTVNGSPLTLRYLSPKEGRGDADLIIVSVKSGHLAQAVEDMRSHVGKDTLILSLMNGITSERVLMEAFGSQNVLYGLTVRIDALREGRDTTFSNLGVVRFGHADNRIRDEKVRAVARLFDKAGICHEVPDDMVYELWKKYMLNCGVNQVSAMLGLNYGLLLQISEAGELADAAMRECAAVAACSGVTLREEDISGWRSIVGALSPEGKTSMLQDIDAGRPTEADMLGGEVAAQGRRFGVPTPANDFLYKSIRALEKKAASV